MDLDAIVLAEAGQKHDSLPQYAISGVAVGIVQVLTLAGRPLGEQDGSAVFTPKECTIGSFEGAPEEHYCTGVFLLPPLEIAMPIAPRAGEVLADLGVAVGHSGHLRIVQVRG